MIKLATWNVNSLKVRQDQVFAWLDTSHVDVLALQETKLTDEQFPREAFQSRGYHVVYSGQKTYNGVAIISRLPITDCLMDLPHWVDPQRRILAATIQDIRLINLYVPNGSAVDSDKYAYKLEWLKNITTFVQHELRRFSHVAIVGDFNIAPTDFDVHDPNQWEGSVLVSSAERTAFTALLKLGLHDTFRQLKPNEQQYTWWDYRVAAFRRNMGLRIDHILLSTSLFARCMDCHIDKQVRKQERPSDHAPIWAELI